MPQIFASRCAVKTAIYGGFPKTSAFGKATLDLEEETGFGLFFPKPFPKPTGFWERLYGLFWQFAR
jgi:hypothetical protein